MNSKRDIWGFGDDGLSLHYDGRRWKRIKNPLTGLGRRKGRLWGSACARPDLCFAGSRQERLIRWDGRRWKEVPSPVPGRRIYAMEFLSRTQGWMAGESFFARWNGRQWRRQTVRAPWIYNLAFADAKLGWAVGDKGAFFRYAGGTFARMQINGSRSRLRGVSCASPYHCWAVGNDGAAFRWDGRKWERIDLGTSRNLNEVALGHGVGFIVGDDALIFKLASE